MRDLAPEPGDWPNHLDVMDGWNHDARVARRGSRTRGAFCLSDHHHGATPSIQVKDVPEETHRILQLRAARAHQSLQEYLRAKLITEASRPTLDEVLDRIDHRSGGQAPLDVTAELVRDDRDRR